MENTNHIAYDFPDDYQQETVWEHPDDLGDLIRESKKKEKSFALSMMEKLNKKVVGQEEAKKALIVIVRDIMMRRTGLGIPKTNILLMGPSGCGKTFLIQNICDMAGVPFAVVNMPAVTGAGYRGEDIENGLERLIKNADGDLWEAENGILFLDEFDKLLIKDGDNASSATVQAQLLKMIEGEEIDLNAHGRSSDRDKPTIDTSNITFIFAGAFTDFEIKKDNVVGFGQNNEIEEKKKDQYEELIDMGFSQELCGRIDRIVKMNGLDKEGLTHIADAITEEYRSVFSYDGVKLIVDTKAKEEAAKEAEKKGLGARGVDQIFKKIFDEARYDIAVDGQVTACRITKESIFSEKAELIRENKDDIDR